MFLTNITCAEEYSIPVKRVAVYSIRPIIQFSALIMNILAVLTAFFTFPFDCGYLGDEVTILKALPLAKFSYSSLWKGEPLSDESAFAGLCTDFFKKKFWYWLILCLPLRNI